MESKSTATARMTCSGMTLSLSIRVAKMRNLAGDAAAFHEESVRGDEYRGLA